MIRHYAGDVVYNINGFIEKNKDTLFQDFKRLLYNSKNEIFRSMWPEGAHDIHKTTKRPQTAGTLFKNSMHSLVKILTSKEPHYFRCIKPNETKSPRDFNDERVIHQVRNIRGKSSFVIILRIWAASYSIYAIPDQLPGSSGEREGEEGGIRISAGLRVSCSQLRYVHCSHCILLY